MKSILITLGLTHVDPGSCDSNKIRFTAGPRPSRVLPSCERSWGGGFFVTEPPWNLVKSRLSWGYNEEMTDYRVNNTMMLGWNYLGLSTQFGKISKFAGWKKCVLSMISKWPSALILETAGRITVSTRSWCIDWFV